MRIEDLQKEIKNNDMRQKDINGLINGVEEQMKECEKDEIFEDLEDELK